MITQGRPRPTALRIAVGLVVLEALVLVGFAVLDITDAGPGRRPSAVGTAVFFVLYAGGQVVAARALLGLARWARGPLVLTQLIQLGLAWGVRTSSPFVAAVLAVVGAVVLGCLLSPASTRSLVRQGDDPTDAGPDR